MGCLAGIRLRLWKLRPICFVCHQHIDDFEECSIEHIVPRSRGGQNSLENLSISHRFCNSIKSDRLVRLEWNQLLDERLNSERSLLKYYTHTLILEAIIVKSFNDYDFLKSVIHAGYRPNVYFENTIQNTSMLKYITSIKELGSDELIDKTSLLDNLLTRNHWKLIYSLILINCYLNTEKYNHCLLHAIWRLQTYIERADNHSLKALATKLLAYCSTLDEEAYMRVTMITYNKNDSPIPII